MKQDLSFVLYERYYTLKNRRIKILLTNGKELLGRFVGFYKGETLWGENYITKWNFEDENKSEITGIYQMPKPNIILQKNILAIYFFETQLSMDF